MPTDTSSSKNSQSDRMAPGLLDNLENIFSSVNALPMYENVYGTLL